MCSKGNPLTLAMIWDPALTGPTLPRSPKLCIRRGSSSKIFKALTALTTEFLRKCWGQFRILQKTSWCLEIVFLDLGRMVSSKELSLWWITAKSMARLDGVLAMPTLTSGTSAGLCANNRIRRPLITPCWGTICTWRHRAISATRLIVG